MCDFGIGPLSSCLMFYNVGFAELIYSLEQFSRGTSHRVYKHPLVPVAVNVQPRRDGKAKSYQVAQVRDALALYTGDDKVLGMATR